MCGILYQSAVIIKAEKNELEHRGPDAYGSVLKDGSEFAHWRLSILGLSGAYDQPLKYKGSILIYNGEIFNYQELGQRYFQRDYDNDSELLIHLLYYYGVDIITQLKGMFAFVFLDKEKKVIIGRDKLGIKPLYYSIKEGNLIVSSEISPIQRRINSAISPDALAEFVVHGVIHTNTVYEDILEFPNSYFATYTNNELSLHKYSQNQFGTKQESKADLEKLISVSMALHLNSDVPVAILLSSGIDSSLLTYYAAKLQSSLQVYTADFGRDSINDELNAAKKLCNELGVKHYSVSLKDRSKSAIIDELLKRHGQPFGDAADIALYALYDALPKGIKVVIQGDGGDELFGGYRRHRLMKYGRSALFHFVLRCLPFMRCRRIGLALGLKDVERHSALLRQDYMKSNKLRTFIKSKKILECLEGVETSCYRKMYQEVAADKSEEQKFYTVDMKLVLKNQFLRKVDIASMTLSKEARVPLLYDDIVDYAMSLNLRDNVNLIYGKLPLRKVAKKKLPRFIFKRKKIGFGVPFAKWLDTELYDDYMSCLKSNRARQVLNVDAIYEDFHEKSCDKFLHWKIYILTKWLRNTI
ncbi:asparagine synthase (glutamine-hydrolyzing) [Akkermansiaceae bacterium]|nr:asparagine synthase (glutamine-hydrolyzing) [Akkermansiaceae bacterium]